MSIPFQLEGSNSTGGKEYDWETNSGHGSGRVHWASLVHRLKSEGNWVRGVDIKIPEYEASSADEFEVLDLRRFDNCLIATRNIDQVYNLGADMGGIGYITAFLAQISVNNTLINAHMLEASRINNVKRFLFSSSACVYAQYKQKSADVTPLKRRRCLPRRSRTGLRMGKVVVRRTLPLFHEGLRNGN